MAALMMFLARMRWLALESRLLTFGERQRFSLTRETGVAGAELWEMSQSDRGALWVIGQVVAFTLS